MELSRIIADPDQPRTEFDQDALKQLADSIRQYGVLQNIRVRWSPKHNKWMVISGERRFRAAAMADLMSIPCVFVEDAIFEPAIRAQQLVENCVRKDLKPIEQAKAFRSLTDLSHWSTQRLAVELNLSKASVVRALALLKLPIDVQQNVDSGTLAPSSAYAITKVHGESQQRKLASEVVDKGLSRDTTQRLVAKVQRPQNRSPAPTMTESDKLSTANPEERNKSVRHFHTRNALVTVEHENAQASPADLQAALLAAVKLIGSKIGKRGSF